MNIWEEQLDFSLQSPVEEGWTNHEMVSPELEGKEKRGKRGGCLTSKTNFKFKQPSCIPFQVFRLINRATFFSQW